MRIATVQHRLRAHERMDLAALLSLCQEASEDGAALIVCPHVPGLVHSEQMSRAFMENVRSYAPGSAVLTPFASAGKADPLVVTHSAAGRTLVLGGDECIDPDLYPAIEVLAPGMMVWQTETESTLQAEALLELALDASQSQSGLIVIAAPVGNARGVESFGGSAIVHLGEIMAEAGDGEEIIYADVVVPVMLPEKRRMRTVPAPVLQQRLAVHRGKRAKIDHLSEGR